MTDQDQSHGPAGNDPTPDNSDGGEVSYPEQWGKVVEQWTARLPEFRAEKDVLEFARDMGIEIPPEKEKEFRMMCNMLGGLQSMFAPDNTEYIGTDEGLDNAMRELLGNELPPEGDVDEE